MSEAPPVCLTIAGSDSGGGAGIQADLKAFAAAGVHGTSAIVALTAQNTQSVTRVEAVSPEMIVAQVAAVAQDMKVAAVKIGMVGSSQSIAAVCEALELLPADTPIVIDPVMVAESGARLLDPEAQAKLISDLLPRATVITPNLPEALALSGRRADGEIPSAEVAEVAQSLRSLGIKNVLITGGHREAAEDVLLKADGTSELIAGPRHPAGAAHGSGCTHSSTLAARLAHGDSLSDAARVARTVAANAVLHGLRGIGHGAGPVDVLEISARAKNTAH